MSKISDQVLRDEEVKLEYMFSYAEYFDKMFPQPQLNELEIQKLECNQLRPHLLGRITSISQSALNNANYNQHIGA